MKSQKQKLYELLQDGQPHRTDSILEVVYGSSHLGIARISARVKDLKDEGHEIEGRKDENNPALFWYKLIPKGQLNLI